MSPVLCKQLYEIHQLQQRIMQARLDRMQCLDLPVCQVADSLRFEKLVRVEQAAIKARRAVLRQVVHTLNQEV